MPAPTPDTVGALDVIPLTREEVRLWLVYTERGAATDHQARVAIHSTNKAIRWPDLYIKDYETRQYLKAWIYCEAHAESFRQVCQQRRGWSYRTGLRRVGEAIETITVMLNFERAAAGGAALVRDGGLAPVRLDPPP
ncbi:MULTISPECIES: hypothetical protein [Methylobacterium]|jgi:hypothetical protein|uniref:hypothetical protein n=1 Tax=Methylobacterium TaxID=407 RepID=UPI0008F1DD3C|nr:MULTISPECIES: hypothetical protein [Methylobacterium]MBZ6415982.1 hypothetical protein [Methylobacterium sp.]MBK3399384.1 hypothetical protein [Methylobacterium ajmalii]MBK3412557.1 hypothetical protein [Methylobacterium ajmalii]MBK3423151.1 hypothetical protein [Methylobacterium ajmalii]SFF63813.1 hypothetical protein SAMN04487844_13347 [Methylobacterium sp. yr596]